jgi:hypothetical protein
MIGRGGTDPSEKRIQSIEIEVVTVALPAELQS